MAYLVASGPDTLPLAGKPIRVFQWEDGRVELQHQGRKLPYSVFEKNPCVPQGVVVENKRLGAALAIIQAAQAERDRAKLASRTLTIREKERVRAVRAKAGAPPLESRPEPKDRTFLLGRRAVTSVKVVYDASSGWTDYAACFLGAGLSAFCSSTSSSSRLMVM